MVKSLRLYCRTSAANAAQLVGGGPFRDDEGKDASGRPWQGVRLSDRPPDLDAMPGDKIVSVDVWLTPDDLEAFGRDKEADRFRAFVIPADILNSRAVVFLNEEEIDFEFLPFYRGEVNAVRDCLRENFTRQRTTHDDVNTLISDALIKIVNSAAILQAQVALQQPAPRKLRLRQKLDRLKARNASSLTLDLEVLVPLFEAAQASEMLGERRALEPSEDNDPSWGDSWLYDATKLREELTHLTAQELQACVEQVSASLTLLADKVGRPGQIALDNYVVDLFVIFQDVTGKQLTFTRSTATGEVRGPGLKFFRPCLAPYQRGSDNPLTDEALAHLLRRGKRAWLLRRLLNLLHLLKRVRLAN